MWKRENEPAPKTQSTPAATPVAAAPPRAAEPEPVAVSPAGGAPAAAPVPAPQRAQSTSRAIIGPSIDLTGELTGAEDLLVEGRVQGKIRLPQNSVTVGAKGRISADVQARVVEIEGEVDGHVTAEEIVLLRKSARVKGDLSAPRVVIEDGAKFKGTIDMEPKRAGAAAPASGPRPVPADDDARASAGSTRAS
jgi:cytoskeletal protein CcmA (bactofilin family)